MRHKAYLTTVLAVTLTAGLAAAGVYKAPLPQAGPETVSRPLLAAINGALSDSRAADREIIELDAPTVSHLEAHFDDMGYEWERTPRAVPRVRLAAFPRDIKTVDKASDRKRLFYQTMLPLVLLENERILKDRNRLERLARGVNNDEAPSAFDMAWLIDLKDRYNVSGTVWSRSVREELLQRVNAVPPSLALAMAAFESGWGTSRFTEEANNLFGHWTFIPGTGIIPASRTEGLNHELKVFPDLASSVRAYLHNLNTHWAYGDFRGIRAQLADLSAPDAAERLSQGLLRYSERGMAYIDDVTRLIRVNKMVRFDKVRLEMPGVPTRVRHEVRTAHAGNNTVS
ncbi:MAG: glucosaminidase domain-containing protein [Nitrospirota bacterium]|nr:glucosaminidase domain-containing protein [Nitrospirota bacterium]